MQYSHIKPIPLHFHWKEHRSDRDCHSDLHKLPYIAVSLCSTPVAQCPAALNIVATNTMMKACISQVKVEIQVTYNKLLQPKVTSHQECSQNHSAVCCISMTTLSLEHWASRIKRQDLTPQILLVWSSDTPNYSSLCRLFQLCTAPEFL